MNALQSLESLQQNISVSELGREWLDDPLLERDVWSVQDLGYTKEEFSMSGTRNVYFKEFSGSPANMG